jgi:hypothetical protein
MNYGMKLDKVVFVQIKDDHFSAIELFYLVRLSFPPCSACKINTKLLQMYLLFHLSSIFFLTKEACNTSYQIGHG